MRAETGPDTPPAIAATRRPRAWLSPGEAAAEADVAPATVRAWCARLPGLGRKIGGRWRLDRAAFLAMLGGGGDHAR